MCDNDQHRNQGARDTASQVATLQHERLTCEQVKVGDLISRTRNAEPIEIAAIHEGDVSRRLVGKRRGNIRPARTAKLWRQLPEPMNTIGDAERANSSAGHHFFDDDTMRFFSSRIDGSGLQFHRFFVTTEKQDADTPRYATLRVILDDGSTEDVGGFQRFANPSGAWKALKAALKSDTRVTVRREGDEDAPANPNHYEWRAYIDTLAVGIETTKADAERVAAEVSRYLPELVE